MLSAFTNEVKMKTLIYLIFLCSPLLYTNAYAACTGASPTWSSTPDYTSVNSCVSAATAGDTINVSAGSATWTSTLAITKGITLQGAGVASTIITNTTTDTISISLPSNVAVRITGIYFDQVTNASGAKTAIHVYGNTNGSFALTKLRIDHNTFHKGASSLWMRGWIEGVIDHNNFIDNDESIFIGGDNNYSWKRPIAAGTSHALFIEDNIFTMTNSMERQPNEPIYHQEGARTVVRYNTFDSTEYTNGNGVFYDSHANQNYYTGSGDFRGQPIVEVYNNMFHANHTYAFTGLRGGSALIHDNTFIYDSGSVPYVIKLTEEEAFQTAFFAALRTSWPAQDQINNTFIWNNTLNGSAVTDITVDSQSATFIQKSRDYFMHSPQSLTGIESWSGRAGGSTTAPTATDTSSMAFMESVANAYYPYTPFVYPHPLTLNGFLKTPSAPTNVH